MKSCYYDSKQDLYPSLFSDCDTASIGFTNDILPIMNTNCNNSGCHNSIDKAGGYILDTHTGAAISANDGSLVGSIKAHDGHTFMPFGGNPLDPCDISKINTWVTSGALNN